MSGSRAVWTIPVAVVAGFVLLLVAMVPGTRPASYASSSLMTIDILDSGPAPAEVPAPQGSRVRWNTLRDGSVVARVTARASTAGTRVALPMPSRQADAPAALPARAARLAGDSTWPVTLSPGGGYELVSSAEGIHDFAIEGRLAVDVVSGWLDDRGKGTRSTEYQNPVWLQR